MISKPERFMIVAAEAGADHPLTAFDAALLNAGIGNVNLVKISSILPPGCEEEKAALEFPPGAFVPAAYGSICSEEEGDVIAAAVGVGLSKESFGIIMEHAGHCRASQAQQTVEEMIRESFKMRGKELIEIRSKSVEHTVEKAGAAVAAVVLW